MLDAGTYTSRRSAKPAVPLILLTRLINLAGSLALISVFWTLALIGMSSGQSLQDNAPACVQFTQAGPDGAGPRPRSLADFVTGSGVKAIVRGEVQSVEEGPLTAGSTRRLIVGIVNVSEVIKGSGSISQLAASTSISAALFQCCHTNTTFSS
jgi:hypothetical protein